MASIAMKADTVATTRDKELRSEQEIQQAFQNLTKEEEALDIELEELLSRQGQLESRLKGLRSSLSLIKSGQEEAQKLASVINFTAKLAENVSVKVKQLDLAKSRVSECQQRVNDLIDLKLCSDGVKTALAEEDYEQAAAHLHRFLAMDESLLKLTALDMRDEGGEASGLANLEAALKVLHDAEVRVKTVVSQRFDEAVRDEDLASIERFFKIFPLIKMHDEGLRKFTNFLQDKLVTASNQNLKLAVETTPSELRANVIFADTITLLFEGIARTVEIHQPLIETYYGLGRLLNVLSHLQGECDRQADRILQEFRRKRNLKEKSNRVKEAMQGNVSQGGQKISPRDIDHVLSEMMLLHQRSEMYYKFVRKRVKSDIEVSEGEEKEKRRKLADLDLLITRSGLCHSMQDLLAEYILLEDYFMTENVKVAMKADDQSTSVMLDDIFFILKKCIQRALSGHNVDGICAVVNNACRMLEQDFCGLLQGQLRMGFPSGYLDLTHAYNVLHSSYQQGKLQGGDTERQKVVFVAALNNCDNAVDYIARLTNTIRQDLTSILQSRTDHERDKIDNCLAGFSTASGRVKQVLEQGMELLRQSAIRPRVKPWMDTFVSHDIDDNQLADYEANDPFVQSLILNLDHLLGGFQKSLTERNYELMVAMLTTEVTNQMEKAILKSKFSRLGGLLLDREIRSLVSFLTNVTTWSIRDKFIRLSQIATLLNLEHLSELSDIWGGGNDDIDWKLSGQEAKQFLALRLDFQAQDLKRLRL